MHNQDRDPLIGKMLQASSVSRHANSWRAFLYALHCNPFVKGGRPQPLGRSFEAHIHNATKSSHRVLPPDRWDAGCDRNNAVYINALPKCELWRTALPPED